ncbi:MAG: hypothetical protein ACP5O4_04830 [bacterium]
MVYIPFRVKKIKIDKNQNKIILSVFLFKNNDNLETKIDNVAKIEYIEKQDNEINNEINIENANEINNEIKYKEYIFNIDSFKFIALGYIKEVEELKNNQSGVVKLFKKAITLGMYNDKNEKIVNIKEQIFIDFIIRETDQINFFRIDLSYFDYRDFLKEELTFSSLINMRKFFNKLLEIFDKDLFDNNFVNFLEMNSLQKIQRYNNVYEFQDYVIAKAKEKGVI